LADGLTLIRCGGYFDSGLRIRIRRASIPGH
jgi:hypothetical protein